jgi:hypothetical protein
MSLFKLKKKNLKTSQFNLLFFLQKFHKSRGPLTKSECSDIIKSLISVESFSVGQGAMDILLCLFGFPICAVMAKRIIPGMRSISDDIVIPLATSGSVVFLVKTHKL